MYCIKNNIEIIKRQNNFICTYKMAYNNACNSINTGYSPFFVRLKKESKIIKYTYTKQHKLSNSVPLQLYNYYFLYKVIYNPTILFIPTNPNSDNAQMYGGLASTITGGNFLEGAAIGLVVTALNHALHAALDPDPTQQQKGNEKKVNKTWDDITNERIQKLDPNFKQDVIDFINEAEQNYCVKLRVTDAYRSIDEQNDLYEIGRTKPGKIVTNAKGGLSYHNYGTAIDVVEIKNGKADWGTLNNRNSSIGKLGIKLGFEWGGTWKKADFPHFQKTYGRILKN